MLFLIGRRIIRQRPWSVYVYLLVFRHGSDSCRARPDRLGMDQVVEEHHTSHYSFDPILYRILSRHCLRAPRSFHASLCSVHSEFSILRSDPNENLCVWRLTFFGSYPFCNRRRLAKRSRSLACSCLRLRDAPILACRNEQRINETSSPRNRPNNQQRLFPRCHLLRQQHVRRFMG